MSTTKSISRLYCLVVWSLLAQAGRAMACATCFGASDSDMAKGMNMGILSLLVVVGLVLGMLGAFFIFVARRSALTPMPGSSMQLARTPK